MRRPSRLMGWTDKARRAVQSAQRTIGSTAAGPTWHRRYLLVTRWLAPLCAALAISFFYDLGARATETDDTRVVGKTQGIRRAAPVYTIYAQGRYTYREDVSARMFRTIQVGDTLHV